MREAVLHNYQPVYLTRLFLMSCHNTDWWLDSFYLGIISRLNKLKCSWLANFYQSVHSRFSFCVFSLCWKDIACFLDAFNKLPNHKWQEADQLPTDKVQLRSWTQDNREDWRMTCCNFPFQKHYISCPGHSIDWYEINPHTWLILPYCIIIPPLDFYKGLWLITRGNVWVLK